MSAVLESVSLIFEGYVLGNAFAYVPYGRTVSTILFLINVIWVYVLKQQRKAADKTEYR